MNPYDEIASEVARYLLDNGVAAPETAVQHGRAIVELICDVSPATSDRAGETFTWDGIRETALAIADAFERTRWDLDATWLEADLFVSTDNEFGSGCTLEKGWRIWITEDDNAPFVVIPPATPATKDN